jgi:hypothetical protein
MDAFPKANSQQPTAYYDLPNPNPNQPFPSQRLPFRKCFEFWTAGQPILWQLPVSDHHSNRF